MSGEPGLRRVLTLGPLILYGLGVIVGAGIYVAVGAVIDRAGQAAPLSFLLAGVTAALTGLCYAELGGRFPEASGGVSYVRHGFGSDALSTLVGLLMAFAVCVSAASIAHGAAQYLGVLLPMPHRLLVALIVLGFAAMGLAAVRESVGLAAAMGLVELGGLLVATIAGLVTAPDWDVAGLWPVGIAGWSGVVSGAFLAFFAFIGFETLANLAEEVREPHRTVPRGILGAVGASVVIYVAVVTAVVLADRSGPQPLVSLFPGAGASVFAVIGVIAVANGVLVQIVMLARLFYGMARRGQLPAWLGHVHPTTRVPARATVVASVAVLATALVLPFERLLVLTNLVMLAVFVLVDLALWQVHRRHGPPPPGTFAAPAWVPPVAALCCAGLMMFELLG